MNYEEKVICINEKEWFSLFNQIGVAPRWVTSSGKRAIQLIGQCHHGDNHSALFDPSTLKVNCFSECGQGFYIHTWFMRALGFSSIVEAKDFLEDWIDGKEIDYQERGTLLRFEEYKERQFTIEHIDPIECMTKEEIDEVWSTAEGDLSTLSRLVWAKEDGISPNIMKKFDVKYDTLSRGIFLPHHNINGDIVGIYLRSFLPLRRNIKELHPEMPYTELVKFPRAKYVPVLRSAERQLDEKTSWSFSNSKNLYGLHLAKDEIEKTGIAIIFEGAKSVMLSHQYGYRNAIATHTYGAHLNHINMLLDCGANEIVLAFDKQYQNKEGKQYELFEHKTKELAKRVGNHCKISRIISHEEEIKYKDSPIDCGKEIFIKLLNNREILNNSEVEKESKELSVSIKEIELEMEELKRRYGNII